MSNNGNKPHEGPHGPGCHCDEEEHTAMAIATVLAELLPNLMSAWEAGEPGVSVDLRFDRGKEHYGIAVRAKILEDLDDWPVPDVDTMAEMTGKSEGLTRFDASDFPPPKSENGKEALH